MHLNISTPDRTSGLVRILLHECPVLVKRFGMHDFGCRLNKMENDKAFVKTVNNLMQR